MNWKIPLFKSYWDENDVTSVSNVIRRGTYWAAGPEIQQLEDEIASYVKTKYAVSFNSGTSALHAVLLAHDITNGEVIVPSFTFIATANSVVLAGAKPVFSEIEDQTYGLDPKDVKEKITDKTKAIIPVHYGGGPCKEIKALRKLADDYNLILIEDAAESLGSKIDEKNVGTFGHSAMFSFCQNKVITAGEGGIIVTDDKDLFNKLKLLRSHGRVEHDSDYFSTAEDLDYILPGFNYRLSTLSAALTLSQLNKINDIIKSRREKAQYFNKKLSTIKTIRIPYEPKNYFNVYQMYTIQCQDSDTRQKIQNSLTKAGVMTKIYFEPIHLKTFYKKAYNYSLGDLPKTEQISKKVLTLPIYPTLTEKEIEYIVENIKDFCE